MLLFSMMQRSALDMPNMGTVLKKNEMFAEIFTFQNVIEVVITYSHAYIHPHFLHIGILSKEYSQEIQND